MRHTSKIVSFFIFPTLVFLIHLIASKILHLYSLFPNMDIPFHFMGGFSIAYTATQLLIYLEQEKIITSLHRVIFLVLIAALTATAAVVWEFAEFVGDRLFGTNIQISLANTMQDQFFGLLGGMTFVLVRWKIFQAGLSQIAPKKG